MIVENILGISLSEVPELYRNGDEANVRDIELEQMIYFYPIPIYFYPAWHLKWIINTDGRIEIFISPQAVFIGRAKQISQSYIGYFPSIIL